MATNFEPHECVIFVQSTKICTQENKAIHSIRIEAQFLFCFHWKIKCTGPQVNHLEALHKICTRCILFPNESENNQSLYNSVSYLLVSYMYIL